MEHTPTKVMEFIEGSMGTYKPIRVLHLAPVYHQALQTCWSVRSYYSQIATMRAFLLLQEKHQISPEVSAEDMLLSLVEESKCTRSERLLAFELAGMEEEEAQPLLSMVWDVNVINKMRDVEFEARMLLDSPAEVPKHFRHPKFSSMAKEFAERLTEGPALSPKPLSPREVAIEVVPRVLQGFWVLSNRVLLNMASRVLSSVTVGVTKAVLEKVSEALPTEDKTTLSRSTRDEMVQSIQTEVRKRFQLDTLLDHISSFAPELLTEMVLVAVEHICQLFYPQGFEQRQELKQREMAEDSPRKDAEAAHKRYRFALPDDDVVMTAVPEDQQVQNTLWQEESSPLTHTIRALPEKLEKEEPEPELRQRESAETSREDALSLKMEDMKEEAAESKKEESWLDRLFSFIPVLRWGFSLIAPTSK